MVLNNMEFFTDETVIKVSDKVLSNPSNGKKLVIQITGNSVGINVELQGKLDLNETVWSSIALLDKSGNTTVTSISKNGIYSVDVTGIESLRMEITAITSGKVTAFARLIN